MTRRPSVSGPAAGGPALAAVLLLALAVVAVLGLVARAGPYTESLPTATPTTAVIAPGTAQPTVADDVEAAQDEQNRALAEIPLLQTATLAYIGVLLTILAVGGWFLAGWLRDAGRRGPRRRAVAPGSTPGVPPAAPPLAAAADAAAARVEDGPAREAVVACWLLLQRAGADAGTAPRRSDTAREYAERLAAEQLVTAQPLRRLAELYREARFSTHVVGPELRAAARRELAVLQAELRSGVRL